MNMHKNIRLTPHHQAIWLALHTREGKRHLSGTPLPSQPRHHLPRT